MIDAQLHAWKAEELADTTVRHRRTALLHFYNVMKAPDEANPVQRAWRPKDPKPVARALSPATIAAILKAMPESQTRARLMVMATTGIPHKQLKAVTEADVDWPRKRLRVQGRRKGEGTADRWLPLSPAAIRALKVFAKWQCWGPFSSDSMRTSWGRACKKVGIVARPYDLKHSLGTLLYAQTKDLAAVARLLDVTLQTAQRYTLGAHGDVDAAAMAAVGKRFKLPK